MPLLAIHCSQTLQRVYRKLCFFCMLIGQRFLQVVWRSWSLRFHNMQRRRLHLTEFFWFCWLIWHHMLQIIGSRSEIWHNWISLNNRTSQNKSRVSLLAYRDIMRFCIQLKGVLSGACSCQPWRHCICITDFHSGINSSLPHFAMSAGTFFIFLGTT